MPYELEHTSELVESMTEQEIVDTVVRGARKQGWRKSSHSIAGCSYFEKIHDGSMIHCHAGHLVHPDDYLQMEKRRTKTGLLYKHTAWDALADYGCLTSKHKQLIADLQKAHDLGETPKDIWSRTRDVVINRGLVFPVEAEHDF